MGWLLTSDRATISIGTVALAPAPTSDAGAVRRTMVSVGPSGPDESIGDPCKRMSPRNGSDPGSKKSAGMGIWEKSAWVPAPAGVVNRSIVGWMLAQETGVPPHAPPVQTSGVVQAFRSSQALPSGAVGFEQNPDSGLQTLASWQVSDVVQTIGLDPTHVPP